MKASRTRRSVRDGGITIFFDVEARHDQKITWSENISLDFALVTVIAHFLFWTTQRWRLCSGFHILSRTY